MNFKPVVIDTTAETPLQQLQGASELDIPLEERFQRLKRRFDCLVTHLLEEGFDLPGELIGDIL